MNNQNINTTNIERALNQALMNTVAEKAIHQSNLIYHPDGKPKLAVKTTHIESTKLAYKQLLAYVDLQAECEQNSNFLQKMNDVLGVAFSLWDEGKLFTNQAELVEQQYYVTCYLVKTNSVGLGYYMVMGAERFNRAENTKYFVPALQIQIVDNFAKSEFQIVTNFSNTDFFVQKLPDLFTFIEIEQKFINNDGSLMSILACNPDKDLMKSSNFVDFSGDLISKLKSITPLEAFALMSNIHTILGRNNSTIEKYTGQLNDLFQSVEFQKSQREVSGRLALVEDLFNVELIDFGTPTDIGCLVTQHIRFGIRPNNEVLINRYLGENAKDLLTCKELNAPVIDGYDIRPVDMLETMPFEVTFSIAYQSNGQGKKKTIQVIAPNKVDFVQIFHVDDSFKKLKENIVNFMFGRTLCVMDLYALQDKVLSTKQNEVIAILRYTNNNVAYCAVEALRTACVKTVVKKLSNDKDICLLDLHNQMLMDDNHVMKLAFGKVESAYIQFDEKAPNVPLHILIHSNKVMNSNIDLDSIKIEADELIVSLKDVSDEVHNSLTHLCD